MVGDIAGHVVHDVDLWIMNVTSVGVAVAVAVVASQADAEQLGLLRDDHIPPFV